MLRSIPFFFLLLLPCAIHANDQFDSLCREAEYVVMGTVVGSSPSTPGTPPYTLSFKIIQVGAGGKSAGGALLLHPGDTLQATCIFTDCSMEHLANDTCFLPLVRDSASNDPARVPEYKPLAVFRASRFSPYQTYNTVDRNCRVSHKLGSDGSVTIVRTEQDGKWLKRTEMRMDSSIVSVQRRYEKPTDKSGPTVTITTTRTYTDSGRRIGRNRTKVKRYGIGTRVRTWTFRKAGHPCLRYRVFTNPYTF